MKVWLTAGTNVGKVRQNNEDFACVCPDLGVDLREGSTSYTHLPENGAFAIVTDGMGGPNAGEVAADIAVNQIINTIRDAVHRGVGISDEYIPELLQTAFALAQEEMIRYVQTAPEAIGMGTTVVLIWLKKDKAHIAWCGDSRCYRFRRDEGLKLLTKDHSYVQDLVDRGVITEKEAAVHPENSVITRGLGDLDSDSKPDYLWVNVKAGDQFLLCSDGLCGFCDEELIASVISRNWPVPDDCRDALIKTALEAGGYDNIAVSLVVTKEIESVDREKKRGLLGWIRRCLSCAVLFFITGISFAQTARWIVRPEYASIVPLSSTVLKVEKDKRFGLIRIDGEKITDCAYDQITNYNGGYCLLLSSNRLRAIVNEQGRVVPMDTGGDMYYVDEDFPYFSEGLLALHTSTGHSGYVDGNGVFVRYPFLTSNAKPFVNGYAVVLYGKDTYVHISRNGAINKLGSDFKNNHIIFASSFTKMNNNLIAVVVDTDFKVYMRDVYGGKYMELGEYSGYDKILRVMKTDLCEIVFTPDLRIGSIKTYRGKSKGKETVLSTWTEPIFRANNSDMTSEEREGLFNLQIGGNEIFPAQFELVVPLSSTNAIIRKAGKTGVLQVRTDRPPALIFECTDFIINHNQPVNVVGRVNLANLEKTRCCVKSSGGAILYDDIVENGELSFSYEGFGTNTSENQLSIISSLEVDEIIYPSTTTKLSFSFEKGFSIKLSASKIICKPGDKNVAIRILIKNNTLFPSAPCSIFINGIKTRSALVFGAGEEIGIPYSEAVDFGESDSISRSIIVSIREEGCPEQKEQKVLNMERKKVKFEW